MSEEQKLEPVEKRISKILSYQQEITKLLGDGIISFNDTSIHIDVEVFKKLAKKPIALDYLDSGSVHASATIEGATCVTVFDA